MKVEEHFFSAMQKRIFYFCSSEKEELLLVRILEFSSMSGKPAHEAAFKYRPLILKIFLLLKNPVKTLPFFIAASLI